MTELDTASIIALVAVVLILGACATRIIVWSLKTIYDLAPYIVTLAVVLLLIYSLTGSIYHPEERVASNAEHIERIEDRR
jgi:hypothetical protein